MALAAGLAASVDARADDALRAFGTGFAPHPALSQPKSLDVDGDGRADRLHVVRVAARAAVAPGVTIANPWQRKPLGRAGIPVALAIEFATGERHLVTDAEFFSTPIWRAAPLPLEIVPRDSRKARRLGRLVRGARGDLLLLGTEAGIDIALYWDGRAFRLAWPDETP